MDTPIVPQKRCTKCKQEFPATRDYFHCDKNRPSGLYPECKACRSTAKPKPTNLLHKRCRKCGVEYPTTLEFFRKDRDVLSSQCKPCLAERDAHYYATHREQSKTRCARYKTENLQARREYEKRYREEHALEASEYAKNYYEVHGEQLRERNRANQAAHPEARRIRNQRSRALKQQAQGSHTLADIDQLLKGQGNRCWYCGCDLTDSYHIDHFIPLSKGGANEPGNLRLACASCNLKKNNKDPHLWSGRLL